MTMLPAKTILLYGNSILIDCLTSKLKQVGGWEVKRVENGCIGDLSGACVIAFDLRDKGISEGLARLRGLPGVTLIGMDALTDTVTIVTDQPRPTRSVQDILDMLKKAM